MTLMTDMNLCFSIAVGATCYGHNVLWYAETNKELTTTNTMYCTW